MTEQAENYIFPINYWCSKILINFYFQFKEINHAHAVLSIPTRRKVYDEYGDMGLKLMEQFGDDGAMIGLAFKPWFKVGLFQCKNLIY